MKVPVNLASEPFRNNRPMLAVAGVLASVMLVLLGLLIYVAAAERDAAKDIRGRVDRLERDLARVQKQTTDTQGFLKQAGNAEVFERSVFLNEILQRKGVSWTKLFADLEKVMPGSVRLISIRPEVTQHDVQLDLQIGTTTVESAYKFFMQLEASPQFGSTTVKNMLPPSQNEPLYRYRVNVNYVQTL